MFLLLRFSEHINLLFRIAIIFYHSLLSFLDYSNILSRALGIPQDASVNKNLNPEADAAAPIVTIATDTTLGPMGTRALAAAILSKGQGFKIPGYKHLKALRLWKADARDSGCAAIAEILRNGSKDGILLELVELMLSNITIDGARAMGDALTLGANASLTSLRLDMNPGIGDEGAALLMRGLRTNRNLKIVTLSYCNLGPLAAQSIASVITSPLSVIEAIDLTGNSLTSVGLAYLANAARNSTKLKELILCDNQIGGNLLLPNHVATLATNIVSSSNFLLTIRKPTNNDNSSSPGSPGENNDDAMDSGLSSPKETTTNNTTSATSSSNSNNNNTTTSEAGKVLDQALQLSADVTKYALTVLGETLAAPITEATLCRVNLEMNPLTTNDATILQPYFTPENKKIELFKIDTTLPPAIFVSLIRIPAPAKGKKKKK